MAKIKISAEFSADEEVLHSLGIFFFENCCTNIKVITDQNDICPSCGQKKPLTILLKTSPYTIAQYFTWKYADTDMCIQCYVQAIDFRRD